MLLKNGMYVVECLLGHRSELFRQDMVNYFGEKFVQELDELEPISIEDLEQRSDIEPPLLPRHACVDCILS